jgi:hypothetical protein
VRGGELGEFLSAKIQNGMETKTVLFNFGGNIGDGNT